MICEALCYLLDFLETHLLDIIRLEAFLPHCVQFGFFLNVDRFWAAADIQILLGHPSYPSSGVLNAIYLWGIHLSHSLSLLLGEHEFLVRALQHIAIDSLSVNPRRILDTLQAEILLSYYFFRVGRFAEAKSRAGAAVSFALAYGFHRITPSGGILTSMLHGEMSALPPTTSDRQEQINGFWAVLVLHKFVSVALEIPSSICGALEAPGMQIDTPWPSDWVTYASVRFFLFCFRLAHQLFNIFKGISTYQCFEKSSYWIFLC